MKTVALVLGSGLALMLGACGSSQSDVDSQEGEVGGSEMLISVRDDSDFGNTIRMKGYVRLVEGNETKLSLRNDSRQGAPEIATHWIHGDRMAYVSFDESVRLGNPGDPTIPAAGDCISIANLFFQHHGGRPTEFGAFAYSYVDGRGDPHPAWATNGSKVYRNAQECLTDPQRAAIPATKPAITKVWDASDFGNVIALRGAVEFKAGVASADLVLANASNPDANVKGSIADVKIPPPPGAEKGGIFEFETLAVFGDLGNGRTPAEDDCVSVKSAGAEIGAFTYHHESGRAEPSGKTSKIFATSAECLAAKK